MPISTSTPSLVLDFEKLNRFIMCLISTVTAIIIVIYDHLITLDREIIFIWAGKWTFAKLLFLANRYWVLSGAMFSIYGAALALAPY
ncbi:hypothetical protein GALMADRAFT_147284 [Galerina marginata CBS 339.88]|uniref:DUF6533 domain-containing protein n=1 Tax=Galerina marginata (strain CBS 339.88) TaxID=685588 RepID=A0A067SKJ0_GALM3|nr:hypothetical protein GALMADRAFT_147284 [Galerina marginata CBS 339.88]